MYTFWKLKTFVNLQQYTPNNSNCSPFGQCSLSFWVSCESKSKAVKEGKTNHSRIIPCSKNHWPSLFHIYLPRLMLEQNSIHTSFWSPCHLTYPFTSWHVAQQMTPCLPLVLGASGSFLLLAPGCSTTTCCCCSCSCCCCIDCSFVVVGASSLQESLRHTAIWIYCVPPDPNASIRIPTWVIIMAISGIETLMWLGLLDKAHFKAAKSLTAWK